MIAVAARLQHSLVMVDLDHYSQLCIRYQEPRAELSWTGGRGPFQVMPSADLSMPGAWENIGEPVTTNTVLLTLGAGSHFLRVLDLAPRR